MTITAKNVSAKLFVAFVAAAMLFTLAAPSAKAATTEELQAQITALMAQIAALSSSPSTGAGAAACTFTRALTLGSEGSDVNCLQNYLTSAGHYKFSGGSTGYFGPVTASAVAAWQGANGVTPAVGYFGPVSQAKYAALMAATPATPGDDSSDDDSTSGDLGDGEGSIASFDEVSSDDSNINEGETGEIFAFTAEIEGDVEINRVDVYLENTAAGAQSDNADDYFSGATLLADGEEVGSLDVDAFDEDSYGVVDVVTGAGDEYRLRFSGLKLVYADGDEPEFTLAFDANNSIDSTDLTEDWGVALADDSVRFVDGEGFSDSDGDVSIEESFGFDAEETAELEVSESSENPDASTLEVDDQDDSSDLAVLAFEIEEKNGVDTTIDDMTVTLTTTGTVNESTVLSEAKLFNGADEIGSEAVTDGGVINFENLGLEINADDTVELTVKVVANGAEDYNEGDTVTAAFTSIDAAEDANGNDEGDMDISGSADGNTHSLRSTGISVDITDASTDITTGDSPLDDTATFTWEFEVTAFGNDSVYINKDFADIVTSETAGDVDQVYAVTVSTGAALTALSGTISSDADDVAADASAYSGAYSGEEFYKISDSETFTITVTGSNQTDAKQVRAALSNIEWTTDVVTSATAHDADSATINSYTDNLSDDSETPFKAIN